MAVMCVCSVGLLGLGRDRNPWPAVAELVALVAHEDWQVRESAAELAHPDRFRFHPEKSDIRRGTLPLLRALAGDLHPHVRAAAGWALDGPRIAWERHRDHAPHWGGRERDDPALHADAAAGRAGSLPLSERAWLADGCAGTVPPELLADAICSVRNLAAWNVDLVILTDPIVGALYGDPCEQVRHTLVGRVGLPEGADLTVLDEVVLRVAARTTRHPSVLSQLGTLPDPWIREGVAGNPACPLPLLLTLAEDLFLTVRAVAYGNPGWPDDRPVRPTVALDDLPRESRELAEAVLGTRTPVRCMAGRSVLAIPAGYLHPPADAPGLCARDAVALHSWGAFCYKHQHEVDGARQHKGADGYLGQRMANAVWVPLGQGGPLAAERDLWDGQDGPLGL